MWDSPGFLDLPGRDSKPRARGLTHVLDKGLPVPTLEAFLAHAGHLVDVVKVGWGIGYVDPSMKDRVRACADAGVAVCLGGTLLEVAVRQGRLVELTRWASGLGVDAVEVSNGLQLLTRAEKHGLVRRLATDFVVLAEAGAKGDHVPVVVDEWLDEMEGDLAAGASRLIAEGRESGTVGLYHADGTVREDLVAAIAARVPVDQVIFEAPRKAQQVWFVRNVGPEANLGNVAPEEVLALETLRLGLRADTALIPR